MEKNKIFNEEFAPHYADLYRSALRLTWDATEAADLVQDTVTKVLEKMDQYKPGTNALAYMRVIAKNAFLNKRKQITTRKTQLVDEDYLLQYDSEDESAAFGFFTELLKDQDSFSDEVKSAIAKIRNDEHFHVFALMFDGYKSAEIATELEISENTVKGIIRRLRIMLIENLREYALENYSIRPDIKMHDKMA